MLLVEGGGGGVATTDEWFSEAMCYASDGSGGTMCHVPGGRGGGAVRSNMSWLIVTWGLRPLPLTD